MIAYLDTSFLVKLYVLEADSPLAIKRLQSISGQPMISWLSDVEMASALHAGIVPKKSIQSAAAATHPYTDFRLDAEAGVYNIVPLEKETFAGAALLAEKLGRKHSSRALDILHVAAAMHHGADAFATFDLRQAKLAEDAGLKLLR